MKKLFLLSFVLVGLAITSSAQDRLAIGLKTGFNSTKLKLNNVPSTEDIKSEAKAGFLIGAYGRLKLLGSLSFQPEIYYAKKQTGFAGESVDIHTWDIPLLANLKIFDLKVAKIYGLAGPVASFISKSDISDFKTTNWTFQAGGGLEIWKLSADVRYEWGIRDISNFDIGAKTNVLTFTIGYRIFGI